MEVPPPNAIRERVFDELDQVRARYHEAIGPRRGELAWLGVEMWIDRVRKLVIDLPAARRFGVAGLDTVPADRLEELSDRGCRRSITQPSQIAELLAGFVVENSRGNSTGALVAELVNFTIVQPMVNPAFGSLFWLGLDVELNPRNTMADSISINLGPMAIDLVGYPESRAQAGEARIAQVEYVREHLEQGLDDTWLSASDEAWARKCADLLRANRLTSLVELVVRTAERLG